MVSRNRARDDADGRRHPVLPDRDRHRAARPGPRHLAAMAAGDDRPCGVERRPGGRRQPHRHRARPALLRPQLHLRRARRHSRRVRSGRDGRAGGDARPRRRPRSTAPPSASSATAGRSFTGGWSRTFSDRAVGQRHVNCRPPTRTSTTASKPSLPNGAMVDDRPCTDPAESDALERMESQFVVATTLDRLRHGAAADGTMPTGGSSDRSEDARQGNEIEWHARGSALPRRSSSRRRASGRPARAAAG